MQRGTPLSRVQPFICGFGHPEVLPSLACERGEALGFPRLALRAVTAGGIIVTWVGSLLLLG